MMQSKKFEAKFPLRTTLTLEKGFSRSILERLVSCYCWKHSAVGGTFWGQLSQRARCVSSIQPPASTEHNVTRFSAGKGVQDLTRIWLVKKRKVKLQQEDRSAADFAGKFWKSHHSQGCSLEDESSWCWHNKLCFTRSVSLINWFGFTWRLPNMHIRVHVPRGCWFCVYVRVCCEARNWHKSNLGDR